MIINTTERHYPYMGEYGSSVLAVLSLEDNVFSVRVGIVEPGWDAGEAAGNFVINHGALQTYTQALAFFPNLVRKTYINHTLSCDKGTQS